TGETADQDRDLRGGPGVPAVLRGDGRGDERSDALTAPPGDGSRRPTGAAARRRRAPDGRRWPARQSSRRRPLQPGRVRARVRGVAHLVLHLRGERPQLLKDLRVRNVVSDVGHLARVGDQVVQLLFRGHDPVRRAGGAQAVVVVVDVLVRGGAHAVVGGGVVLGVVVLPVAVVDGLSPVLDLFAAQLRQEAAALLVGEVLGGAAGDLEQGGGEVDVRDDVGD